MKSRKFPRSLGAFIGVGRIRFPLGATRILARLAPGLQLADFAFAFMDCEFGGLDPELHDITEIAVILTDYRLDELAAGEWKIAARPHRITRESAEISGYRTEDWQGAPHLREVLAAIDALL